MPDKVFGYPIRNPKPGELKHFEANPRNAGMATSDNAIILNPNSGLKPEEILGVLNNEASRIWMRQHRLNPGFTVTPEQQQFFSGTAYGQPGNELAMKHTILGRIIGGDPSAGNVTPDQKEMADYVLKQLLRIAP